MRLIISERRLVILSDDIVVNDDIDEAINSEAISIYFHRHVSS